MPEPLSITTTETDEQIDINFELAKATEKVDKIRESVDRRNAERQRDALVDRVKKPVERCLSAIGLSEQEVFQALKAIGGFRAFEIDPDTGEPVLLFDGVLRPISEILPVHPAVGLILQHGSNTRNPEGARVARIAAINAEIEQLKVGPANTLQTRLMKRNQLARERRELEAKAPEPVLRKPRQADAALILQRRERSRRLNALQDQFRADPRRNDVLVEIGKESTAIQKLDAEIARQQLG